jgi:MFS family permease
MTAAAAYLARLQGFTPNAKLLLARSLISPLGFGIWSVAFNIYLLSIVVDGNQLFGVDFIFTMVAVDWLVHGLAAFPGGLFSDRFGRRNTFLIASAIAIVASLGKLFTLNPVALLALSGLAGFGSSFHAVTSGPFLIENCSKEDRSHLFSAQTTFGLAAVTCGALLGGLLPTGVAFARGLNVAGTDETRLALIVATPLLIIGLVPIYLICERWTAPDAGAGYPWYSAWTRNITSRVTIWRLCLVTTIGALGVGAVVPVLNAFFFDRYGVHEESVGYIFAISSFVAAISMMALPYIVARIGKVRTIAFTKLLAIPFILLIPALPYAAAAAVPFVMRAVLSDIGGPIFSLFVMEQVNPNERGATAGLIHSASEFPMGIVGLVMGWVMAAGGEWNLAFGASALFTLIAYLLFLRLFGRVERIGGPAIVGEVAS